MALLGGGQQTTFVVLIKSAIRVLIKYGSIDISGVARRLELRGIAWRRPRLSKVVIDVIMSSRWKMSAGKDMHSYPT